MPATQMSRRPRLVPHLAVVAAVALPYLVFKVLWLSGSIVGMTSTVVDRVLARCRRAPA